MSTDLQPAQQTGTTGVAAFDHAEKRARVLASAMFIPDHLRAKVTGNTQTDKEKAWLRTIANCLLVVNQADRWEMDPFAVAGETYVVGNKLGYSGKLVAAVVNSRAQLASRLSYSYAGAGDKLTCTVSGTFRGETAPRTVSLSVAQAKTANKMWITDPEQKLAYSAVTRWARRHTPELMLGVVTREELEEMARDTGPVAKQATTVEALLDDAAPDDPDCPTPDESAPAPETVVQPEPAPEAPDGTLESDTLEGDYAGMIGQQKSLTALAGMQKEIAAHAGLLPAAKSRLEMKLADATAVIKGTRGEKSNAAKPMFS